MKKIPIGARVQIDMKDIDGNDLYGEIISNYCLGFCYLVHCETRPPLEYNMGTYKALFLPDMVKKVI